MTILFCNVGWMERYQGLRVGDQISGGGAYVKEKREGGEVCNFSPDNDTLYGYVRTPGPRINLERLGANGEDSITGITVVWTAPRPDRGGTVIVGWYKDATVFRDYQEFKETPRVQSENEINGYRITAPAGSAVCLPVDARIFKIRRGEGWMGQSHVWYADSPERALFVEEVRAYTEGTQSPRTSESKHGRSQDQERKVKVEKAAIHACSTYFENLGYDVDSVEKDNVGWDLVAKNGRSSLRIEVKGLSGVVFSVELTPNEYSAFAQQANDYRLAVVTNALESPSLLICRYSEEQAAWVVEANDGLVLEIKVKQSASITCFQHDA